MLDDDVGVSFDMAALMTEDLDIDSKTDNVRVDSVSCVN